MTRFLTGFVTGGMILTFCALGYLRLGLADFRADAPAAPWVNRWMFSAVHASVRRSVSPDLKSPLPADDETLIAGGKLYLNDCVGCYGAPGKFQEDRSNYPPVPQLAQVGTQYSEAEMYWIIKHGIRNTAMSAYGPFYSDKQMWALASFLRHIDRLPRSAETHSTQKDIQQFLNNGISHQSTSRLPFAKRPRRRFWNAAVRFGGPFRPRPPSLWRSRARKPQICKRKEGPFSASISKEWQRGPKDATLVR